MKNIKLINSIEKYIVIATIAIYPVFVSTLFINVFETSKLLLFFTSVTLLLLLKIIKIAFFKEELSFTSTPKDISLIIFTFFYITSGIINNINKTDMFLSPASGSFVILSLVFYLILNQFKKEEKEIFLNSLLLSGFLVSVVQIISIFGITKLIPFLPDMIKTEIFTPTGNILSSIILIIVLLPIVVKKLFQKVDIYEKILSTLIITVFLISIIGSIYLILPNKNTSIKILNVKTGWSLAVDSLKASPLLGTGATNFSYIFNKYRPIEYNADENWQIKYIQNSSLALTILTESGILGFLAFAFFLFKTLNKLDLDNPIYIAILIFSLGTVLLPLPFMSLPIFIIIVACHSEVKNTVVLPSIKKNASLFLSLVLVVGLTTTSILGYKLIYAEYIFAQSIRNVGQNQGVLAYNLINTAVKLNPYSDRYHLFSSAINLALAEALSTKAEINDEDKANISKLVQQSIREGKAAVAVAKYKSSNWESLSDTYRKLVSFAEGADIFAIESLNQAISLDPINPILRIKLGSLYFSQTKYDLAIDTFKLAIVAKPDLPNAHYNLAIAYKENKQLNKSKEEINTTLNLLGKESSDYEKALLVLQDIEELTKPEKSPEPVIEPQVELPTQESLEPQI